MKGSSRRKTALELALKVGGYDEESDESKGRESTKRVWRPILDSVSWATWRRCAQNCRNYHYHHHHHHYHHDQQERQQQLQTFYHRWYGCAIPPSPSVEPRVYGAANERERPGNRAINNYRMKKGARYPPGAPKPRLHTPHRPLPSRAVPASYKPRARARPRQLYPRTRNVLLPWRRMLSYDESGWSLVCVYVCARVYRCICRVCACMAIVRCSTEMLNSTCPTFLTSKSLSNYAIFPV